MTRASTAGTRSTGPDRTRYRSVRQIVALLVVIGLVMSTHEIAEHVDVHLGDAAPLLGNLHFRISAHVLPVLGVGAAAVVAAPWVAARAAWLPLLAGTWIVSAGWGLALAFTDGVAGITHPLTTSDEYLPDLVHVHGLGAYIAGFTRHVHDPPRGEFLWSTHVSGGPPGPLLLFSCLARVGLGGAAWAALVVVAIGSAAAPAAVLTARRLCDEATARRVAPFVALAPFAIWTVTSADALFLGLSASGIALMSVAATSRGRRGDAAGLGAGVLLGAALYSSYGIAPFGLVALAVPLSTRRLRPLITTAVGVGAVAAVFGALGFWWWTGLSATRVRYAESIAAVRPYGYFLVADLAAFALALGPAAVAGLASLQRRSRLWWVVAASLLAGVASDLSGLSKGEVERIWLPFAIWPLLTVTALGDTATRRRWLAAQILFAIALQTVLVTDW